MAKALDKTPALSFEREVVVSGIMGWRLFDHADPATCMGLIKEHRATIDQAEYAPKVEVIIWYALTDDDDPDFDSVSAIGDTVEQAVARCVVQMRLGDVVEIPDELCGVQS